MRNCIGVFYDQPQMLVPAFLFVLVHAVLCVLTTIPLFCTKSHRESQLYAILNFLISHCTPPSPLSQALCCTEPLAADNAKEPAY